MHKPDALTAPPKAFNPKAAKAVSAYMDMPRMVMDGNLTALKAASMLNVNLSKPYSVQASPRKAAYETQLIVLAMEAGQTDAFNFLVASHRSNLNLISNYQHGPKGINYVERGTPLDAAYNLKRHNVEGAQYFYEQLIANGARNTVGKHAAEIKKDLPKAKLLASAKTPKAVTQAAPRPGKA